YIFWFHMPFFFILSGFVFKPAANWNEFNRIIVRRARQLLIPYLSFFFTILIIKIIYLFFLDEFSIRTVLLDMARLLYGGQALSGFYATFWFITCLFTTHVVFLLIHMHYKSGIKRVFLVAILFFLAHFESYIVE